MSRVFWDTNLFIYLIEATGERGIRTAAIAERMAERGDQLYTSVLTLGEILVKPIEKRNVALQKEYEAHLARHSTLIPFDQGVAKLYAEIRQDRSIRPPDAIQLSCAASARVDLFITNDERLSKKVIPGISFIASLEKAFL